MAPAVVDTVVDTVLSSGGASSEDSVPFFSIFCGLTACYFAIPQCIGCTGELDLCCLHADYYNCKVPNKEISEDNGKLCILGRNNCFLHQPEKLPCLCSQQYFCFDSRCGLPKVGGLDSDLPFALTCCFITLFNKDKFVFAPFKTIKDLK